MKPNSINVTFSVSQANFDDNNGEHTVQLDLSKLTEEDWNQFALRSIVIALQATLRGKGDTAKNFDADKPFVVNAPGSRIATGGAVGKVTKLLAGLTDEQKRAIAESMGFTFNPAN